MCLKKFLSLLPKDPARRMQMVGTLLIASAVFSLGFAYTAQYGFGLRPCILCLYQRVPYVVIAALGIMVLGLARICNRVSVLVAALAIPAFLSGAAIGFFQVGVEQKWWRGTDECTGASIAGLSPEEALARLSAAPLVRCDEVQFEFLGISMAGYNALWSLGLAVFFAAALFLAQRKKAGSCDPASP